MIRSLHRAHVLVLALVLSIPIAFAQVSIPVALAEVRIEAPSCVVSSDGVGVRVQSSTSSELALELRLARFGRDGALSDAAAASPRPSADGFVLERGAGVREHWAARAHGVEFYIELEHPRPGGGDFIARYSLDAHGARASSAVEGGLVWSLPGVGSLSMGGLMLVAADGRRRAGELALRDGELELRAPAEFLDGAAYPLRLDPLLGSVTMLSQPHPFYDNSAKESDVAHDDASDRFLVVWREPAPSSGFDVRAQLTDMAGAKIGSSLLLASGVAALGPRVGAVRSSGRFAVAWQDGAAVRCRLVRASDGALSSTLTVSSSAASSASVDVSGDATGKDDAALVVWRGSTGAIRGVTVATATGSPVLGVGSILVDKPTFGALGSLAISKSGGAAGRHCLAWETRTLVYPTSSLQYLSARLFDRELAPIGAAVALTSGDSLEEAKPDVDGNGNEFVVVYAKGPQGAPDGCFARSVRHSAGALVTYSGETQLNASYFRHDLGTAVAMSGGKAFALWVEQPTINSLSLRARGLAPNGCVTCEATFDVALALPFLTFALPAIGAELGGAGEDRLLATWQSNASGPRLTIHGRPLEAFGPGTAPVDLGGACGNAGAISSSGLCAPGSTDFRVELAGAEPGATTAVLWQSFAPYAPVSCGTCVSESSGVSYLHTLAGGATAHTFAIPCNASLVGATTRFQWRVYNTSQTPCAQSPGLSQTSRLECTYTQ